MLSFFYQGTFYTTKCDHFKNRNYHTACPNHATQNVVNITQGSSHYCIELFQLNYKGVVPVKCTVPKTASEIFVNLFV